VSFTPGNIIMARRMRSEGANWEQVARAIGRRSAAGIKRRLDPEFHERSNIYQARWMRARRADA
jgi:hypothetical protein